MENFQDLEHMEIDTFKQIPDWVAIRLAKRKSLAEELDCEGHISFEDDSITLHGSSYQKYTRKLPLQCVCVKGNYVIEKWGLEIEIKNKNPSDVMELHRETVGDLVLTVNDHERENARLKKRTVELEVSLISCPLFYKPLAIVQPVEDSTIQAYKFGKITHLLLGV
jgi:hypothetical protein